MNQIMIQNDITEQIGKLTPRAIVVLIHAAFSELADGTSVRGPPTKDCELLGEENIFNVGSEMTQ